PQLRLCVTELLVAVSQVQLSLKLDIRPVPETSADALQKLCRLSEPASLHEHARLQIIRNKSGTPALLQAHDQLASFLQLAILNPGLRKHGQQVRLSGRDSQAVPQGGDSGRAFAGCKLQPCQSDIKPVVARILL